MQDIRTPGGTPVVKIPSKSVDLHRRFLPDYEYSRLLPKMIEIPKKVFFLMIFGLSTLAVASVCSILRLEMHQAVMCFMGTWIFLVCVFEGGSFIEAVSRGWQDSSKHK